MSVKSWALISGSLVRYVVSPARMEALSFDSENVDDPLERDFYGTILAIRTRLFLSDKVRLTGSPSSLFQTDCILRCLLGFAQGGFIPDVVLYLSYYYTTSECKPQPEGAGVIPC